MGDDVGVHVLAEVKAIGKATRITVGIGVGDMGDASRAREAGCDGSGGISDVRSCGEAAGVGRWVECSLEETIMGAAFRERRSWLFR